MEDEEHEESYKRLRGERRQIFLHDYPELYSATTEHGDLILQERSQIVHWIIEQLTKKEFELESGDYVSWSWPSGPFPNKRVLQEQKTPSNFRVRQENFYIGNNMYSRSKVVHGHGMAGAGGPYLPMFLAHHPQLHVVHVRTNENDLQECIKATLCHIFVPVPRSTITVKKLVSESHGCKSTYVFTLSTLI
ncbi:hypothetical protein H0E87_015697 [Populus deltoides]|uniref:Uncharacterized protein n=1 Tax=Populus deltoides TaxID=3696 RepID=A0A8T2Y607_POPDE|nr:hypothetical protein H0E87_015697 [Populus deltoides]